MEPKLWHSSILVHVYAAEKNNYWKRDHNKALTSLAAAVLLPSVSRTSRTLERSWFVVLRDEGNREISSGSVITASCWVSPTVRSIRTTGSEIVANAAIAYNYRETNVSHFITCMPHRRKEVLFNHSTVYLQQYKLYLNRDINKIILPTV